MRKLNSSSIQWHRTFLFPNKEVGDRMELDQIKTEIYNCRTNIKSHSSMSSIREDQWQDMNFRGFRCPCPMALLVIITFMAFPWAGFAHPAAFLGVHIAVLSSILESPELSASHLQVVTLSSLGHTPWLSRLSCETRI